MKKKYRPIILSIILLLVLFVAPFILAFNKTGRDTKILNKDYSVLNKAEIIAKIEKDFSVPHELIFNYDNREFKMDISKFARLDKEQIASDLLFRRLNKGVFKYIVAFFAPHNFPLVYTVNNTVFDEQVEQIVNQINKPFVPSELAIDKTAQIQYKKGELGREVDRVNFKNNIIYYLSYNQIGSFITVPVDTLGTLPAESEINDTITKAQKLISKTLSLVSPEETVTVDDKTIISWLDFNSSCRQSRLQEYVASLKSSLKKDPVDAVFKFENNKVMEFKPAQKGYSLDDQKLATLLCRNLLDVINNTEKTVTIDLPLLYVEPKIANSQVNDLGIKELLGKGTSSFRHSSTIRNFNVEKGSSIVNSILVPPGETFSFIKSLGDVSLDAGYKKAYIIRAGKTELDVGGGICQVSTTLFRAMLNAGLEIIERHPHAYRVSYYEEDTKPGFDATVFIPKPDLRFVNDTGHHILIQSTYDGVNKKLTYEIYGTNDGRVVDISNYRQWGSAPPPPDVYIDDPTLPPGKVVQDEQRIPGLKTAFDWKVARDGKIIHEQTFSSSYVPWAAVFRRGPSQ